VHEVHKSDNNISINQLPGIARIFLTIDRNFHAIRKQNNQHINQNKADLVAATIINKTIHNVV
jgi:hypothetical protein